MQQVTPGVMQDNCILMLLFSIAGLLEGNTNASFLESHEIVGNLIQ